MRKISPMILISAALLLEAACRQDMHDQPRYKPLSVSTFFADGRSARPVPEGTIARDALNDDDSFHTGSLDGKFMTSIPLLITEATLRRGQERFDIFCSPCHSRLGTGDGMIALRGFKRPADLNSDRVRQEPPGYLFQVITNGFGAMPDHRDQIPAEDRWAIVAYIRALELSRGATLADVPPESRSPLETQQ